MKASKLLVPMSLFLPFSALAEQDTPNTKYFDSIGVSVSFVSNDAGSGSDFEASARFSGFAEKQISENLSLQIGISQSTDADDTGDDNTGEYKLTISHSDVFGGAKFTFNPQDQFKLYARGGVLYYYSQIELEESFFGLKESGSEDEVEEGTGFYIGGGVALDISPEMKLEVEITHLQRSKYFDDASRSFDFEETGLRVGLVYRLP